ncbi:DUF6092 family protein [Streptomyces sp. NBC_01264]|uniref:DUF6092 family protein n=1 Tax=Streptomyces sp. NBC_01264 TaxID=2903804 RepID=UPI00224D373E|nr:DUF6092 family protein [Streptomyces sp. NBC_01264]MCX4775735.1 DUF6092 family protein [Streptomyces sp. NBC_01264]
MPSKPAAPTPPPQARAAALVLSEEDAVELLAYLVTAASIQMSEAAENAPKRLLTAAGRLAGMITPQAGEGLLPLLAEIERQAGDTAVQAGDPDAYAAQVDDLCRTLAEHLLTRLGLTETQTV